MTLHYFPQVISDYICSMHEKVTNTQAGYFWWSPSLGSARTKSMTRELLQDRACRLSYPFHLQGEPPPEDASGHGASVFPATLDRSLCSFG